MVRIPDFIIHAYCTLVLRNRIEGLPQRVNYYGNVTFTFCFHKFVTICQTHYIAHKKMDSNPVFGFIIIVLINKQKHIIGLLYMN